MGGAPGRRRCPVVVFSPPPTELPLLSLGGVGGVGHEWTSARAKPAHTRRAYRGWENAEIIRLGRKRLNVIVPSFKMRFGAPEPLVICALVATPRGRLSNLAVYLRAGTKLLGTVA